MGKGSGCGSSKNVQDGPDQITTTSSGLQQPPVAQPTTTTPVVPASVTPVTMSSAGTKKIYVVFYTTYGHIYKMVEQVANGINSVPGTEAVVLQVMDNLPRTHFLYLAGLSFESSFAVISPHFNVRACVSDDNLPVSAIVKHRLSLFACILPKFLCANSGRLPDIATPLQVPETLPEGVLEKMHAPPKPDVPVVDVHSLPEADGFVFAFPSKIHMKLYSSCTSCSPQDSLYS